MLGIPHPKNPISYLALDENKKLQIYDRQVGQERENKNQKNKYVFVYKKLSIIDVNGIFFDLV